MYMHSPYDPRCNRTPDQISEYISAAEAEGITPEDYVMASEGTYNRDNGHFLCTECYIAVGQPTGGSYMRWVCP